MHEESKKLLGEAVLSCLPTLQKLADEHETDCQVWTKEAEGQWRGHFTRQPDLLQVYSLADRCINAAGLPFSTSFLTNHPEFNDLVGFRSFGLSNFAHDTVQIVRSVIAELWNRHSTFEVDQSAVESLVSEFEEFVDSPTAEFQFRSQLINFSSQGDELQLPDGIRIRRMNEKEISAIYGGTLHALAFNSFNPFGMHEFCVEGVVHCTKIHGSQTVEQETPVQNDVKNLVEKTILCLRTFKDGPIGFGPIKFIPNKFCPIPVAIYSFGHAFVRGGQYRLDVEEFSGLAEHSKLVFGISDSSMEMACSRLADAVARTNDRDRLVDSVIGMESLLLAALGKGDRKSELKFRFALHYSTLFNTPEERHRRFRIAKDLYDLRSTVAHGSSISDDLVRLGAEKVPFKVASKMATEVLRQLIHHFLPASKPLPYKNHEYWERSYFGLSGRDSSDGVDID